MYDPFEAAQQPHDLACCVALRLIAEMPIGLVALDERECVPRRQFIDGQKRAVAVRAVQFVFPQPRGGSPGRALCGDGASDDGLVIQQLREAMPFGQQPTYLFRDNDGIYGDEVSRFLVGTGIAEVKTAHRCPWQNPFVERYGGTLRRELLDHVIVLNEEHL